MNKLSNSRVIRLIVSLALTLMVFFYVKVEVQHTSPNEIFSNVSEETTETIYDVPVRVLGNIDKYYVSGVPDSVTVELQGPKNVLRQTMEARELQVVTKNLDELGVGTHYIPLQVENLPKDLHARISPSTVKVSIATLETRTFPVKLRLQNAETVPDAYRLADSAVTPTEVELSGPADTLDQVDHVYALVNVPDGQSENYEAAARVIVEDADGRILNLGANPDTVTATIEIESRTRTVPVEVHLENQRPNYKYDIEPADEEIEVSGDSAALDALDAITATVDVGDIDGVAERNVFLEVPAGITSVQPTRVSVTITAKKDADDGNDESENESDDTDDESTDDSETTDTRQ